MMMKIWLGVILTPLAIFLSANASSDNSDIKSTDSNTAESSALLPFSDVNVPLTDLGERYLRTGRAIEAQKIAKLEPGISEQDVTSLLGAPYATGQSPRGNNWEYHISFPITDTNQLVCQYKVVFDPEMQVADLRWRRHQCENLYNQIPKLPVKIMISSTDVLFNFASASLSSRGESELDKMAKSLLSDYNHPRIWVVAHTDRIGSVSDNQILSDLRAQAIGSHLVSRGVPAKQIILEGRGKNEPLVQCSGSKLTPALKDCLAPNRRAQIEVIDMDPKGTGAYSVTSMPAQHN